MKIGQTFDAEDEESATVYVQYLASKILDKYRFEIVDTSEMASFTKTLQEIAKDGDYTALRTERPENHTVRQSTNHLCRQSGLMPLLYKVETIWGTEALTEYWERVLRYYRQFYRQKAVANYRLMKWLHENAASLKKQPLENCFKDLEEDIKQGFIYKKSSHGSNTEE